VKIELTRFFLSRPILLVLIHMGLIGQLVFARPQDARVAPASACSRPRASTPSPRLNSDNFFFVQGHRGPSAAHGRLPAARHVWLTLVVMPVVLLLYVQLVSCPTTTSPHLGASAWC